MAAGITPSERDFGECRAQIRDPNGIVLISQRMDGTARSGDRGDLRIRGRASLQRNRIV